MTTYGKRYNHAINQILRAYKILKRKKIVIQKDIGKNGKVILNLLVNLGIAEKVQMIYKTGKNYRTRREVKGYKLK